MSLVTRIFGKKRLAIAAAAAFLSLGTVGHARAADFFDWLAEGTNGNNPTTPGFVAAPSLSDGTATTVKTFLVQQKALGNPLAVKIRTGVTLSASTINLIFNDGSLGPIKYIFDDQEGAGTIPAVQALRTQLNGTTTGNAIVAGNAFLGNFAVAPINSDPTRPLGNTGFTGTDFRNSGVNMSTENLYPGDASFRNPIMGAGVSTAPNIRSALFTLPIQRLSLISTNMGAGQLHVPYIARFNAFNNTAFDTDPGSPGVQFNTSMGGAQNAAQLLSRNDFQALVLHYRMRGASSFHLLDTGVQGYTQAQEESDAAAGWNNSTVGQVLGGSGGRVANLGTTITVDGSTKSIEAAGVVWSAVTNDNVGSPGLAILISNLTDSGHTITFNTRINNATLSTTVTIGSGLNSHSILRFTRSGTVWGSMLNDPAFNDSNLASRDGVGIPEPASVSILAVGALGVLMRRRRRQA
jgi:hypothetical protein